MKQHDSKPKVHRLHTTPNAVKVLVMALSLALVAGCSILFPPGKDPTHIVPKAKITPGFKPSDVERVAVYVAGAEGGQYGDSIGAVTAQGLNEGLADAGYRRVSVRDMEIIIGDLRRQGSRLTDPATARKAGKMAGASHVLIVEPTIHITKGERPRQPGEIQYYQMTGDVAFRLVQVETGDECFTNSDSVSHDFARSEHESVTLMKNIATRLGKTIPGVKATSKK